ncbi:hypothetical protein Dimus_023589 [Dionaea muscipula]
MSSRSCSYSGDKYHFGLVLIYICLSQRCRRFFGHKPTIRPNAKKLYRVFGNRSNMTWGEFASKVRSHQRGFMGVPNEVTPGQGEFHENPATCICGNSDAKAKKGTRSRKLGEGKILTSKDGEDSDDHNADDDIGQGSDPDYDGQESHRSNETVSDYDELNSDEPELEEMPSD